MSRDTSYFEQLLEHLPEENRTSLAVTATKLGIKDNDTLYLYLLGCHHIVSLCDRIPAELRSIQTQASSTLRNAHSGYLNQLETQTTRQIEEMGKQFGTLEPLINEAFLRGASTIKDTLSAAHSVAIAEQKKTIAVIAQEWARTQYVESLKNHWMMIALPMTALVITLTAVGFSAGYAVRSLNAAITLPKAQVDQLQWAASDEGRQARSLYEWNKDRLKGNQCLSMEGVNNAAAAASGIKLPDGGCFLWVVPPEKRKASGSK